MGAYAPAADKITILPRELCESDAKWYRTVCHELAHGTSHQDRLSRQLKGRWGDKEAYAREERRAQMSAWMLCPACATGFAPGDHASYVASWVPVLKDDPAEIYRASRDASAIVQYLRPPVAGLPTYGITQPRALESADGNENENLLIPAPSSRGLLILPGQCVM